MEHLGVVLRVLRIARGLRQYEVARAAKIDPSRLSRIERDLVRVAPDEQRRILGALGFGAEGVPAVAYALFELLRCTKDEDHRSKTDH